MAIQPEDLLAYCLDFEAEHGAPALIVMLSTIIEDRTEQNGIEMEMDADGVMILDLPTLN
jgi:hypothetical protein